MPKSQSFLASLESAVKISSEVELAKVFTDFMSKEDFSMSYY